MYHSLGTNVVRVTGFACIFRLAGDGEKEIIEYDRIRTPLRGLGRLAAAVAATPPSAGAGPHAHHAKD